MKIVIVGAGSVGFQVARQLIAEGKDVVLIDRNPEVAKHASNRLDCLVLNAEGNSPEVLKNAGIDDADFFLSVTESDEINMICCGIVASEFQVPVNIARVRNLDYLDSPLAREGFMGIDYFVNPEIEAAREIANTVELGAYSDVLQFEKTDIQMRKFHVHNHHLFKNKSLKKIRPKLPDNVLIAGVYRDDKVIIPSGQTIINAGDTLQITGDRKALETLFSKLGKEIQPSCNNIVVVGGGRLGVFTTRLLLRLNRKIKLIDQNYNRCKELSAMFPDVTVIHSDITDETIYEEEQLATFDLMITTTAHQELNMLAAIYGKSMGIKQSIVLVNNSNYMRIANDLGIDATISPKISAVDTILKFVRRGKIRSVHTIFNGQAQIIEYILDANSPLLNKPLRMIRMPNSSLILSVLRDGETYIPGGDFLLHEKDTVIVICTLQSLSKTEDLFTGNE